MNVDGRDRIVHYRQRFDADDHVHVWSVTKSVAATLIGIASSEKLITDLEQPLRTLLPDHRRAMGKTTAEITLRQLLTMTAGLPQEFPSSVLASQAAGADGVDVLLRAGPTSDPGQSFVYSNPRAYLSGAVLEHAPQRAGGAHPRSVLDYARENCSIHSASSPSPRTSRS